MGKKKAQAQQEEPSALQPMSGEDLARHLRGLIPSMWNQTAVTNLTRRAAGNAQLDASQAAAALKEAEAMHTRSGLVGSNAEQRAADLRARTVVEREAVETAQENYRIAMVEHEESEAALRNLRIEVAVYLRIMDWHVASLLAGSGLGADDPTMSADLGSREVPL